jgi:hypothetical protein
MTHRVFIMPEIHPSITRGVVASMRKSTRKLGVCTACGVVHDNIEHNSRSAPCDWCEEFKVRGLGALVGLMSDQIKQIELKVKVSPPMTRQLSLFGNETMN